MQIYWESGLGKSKGDGVGDTLKVQLDKSVYIDNKFHHNQKELFDYIKVELWKFDRSFKKRLSDSYQEIWMYLSKL